MKRSIHNAEVFLATDDFGVDGNGMNHVQINLIHFLADNLNQVLVAVELDVVHSHLIHLVYDGCIVRSEHLRTVIPISLVAVVFSGVVAGCNVDTALATEVANGK